MYSKTDENLQMMESSRCDIEESLEEFEGNAKDKSGDVVAI